ncbi:MAG: chemotaxis protein CheW [Candidatus Schekmanbacteria bacterium]|nr:chemotaxis protein CheW [Candidatus Schekmanbacteria bacterium]
MSFDDEAFHLFHEEAVEILLAMNGACQELADPTTCQEAMGRLFRLAHTLKGAAALEGLAHVAASVHELEALLAEAARRGGPCPTPGTSHLLARIDALDLELEEVCSRRVGGRTDRADSHGSASAPDGDEAGVNGGAAGYADQVPVPGATPSSPAAREVVVELSEEGELGAMRAHLLHELLSGHGAIIATDPPLAELRSGCLPRHTVRFWIESDLGDDELRSAADVGGVRSVVVRTTYGKPAAPPAAVTGEARAAPPPVFVAPRRVSVRAELLDDIAEAIAALTAGRDRLLGLEQSCENLISELLAPASPERLGHREERGARERAAAILADRRIVLHDLDRAIRRLQVGSRQSRLVPIGSACAKLPRMVRDLAARLGKDVHFELRGLDTEIDRALVERLGDPLVHLLRNAVDHGIEPPDERASRGKARRGTVSLTACRRGERVTVTVADDGRGVDRPQLEQRAAAGGLLTTPPRLPAALDLSELLSLPGLTTSQQVSDVSGRGVGLDIVRRHMHELGGSVEVTSVPGAGTSFVLTMPPATATMLAILFEVAGTVFAVAAASASGTTRLEVPAGASTSGPCATVEVNGERRRVLSLRAAFGYPPRLPSGDAPAATPALLAGAGAGVEPVIVPVDRLIGEEEIVVKPFTSSLAASPFITGGAILAGGEPGLVVDLDAVLQFCGEIYR